VATDVVEAAYHSIVATNAYDRIAQNIEAVIVATLRDVVDVADDLPRIAEYRSLFEFEEFGVGIDPTREAGVVVEIVRS
jgi:hypothetical protein